MVFSWFSSIIFCCLAVIRHLSLSKTLDYRAFCIIPVHTVKLPLHSTNYSVSRGPSILDKIEGPLLAGYLLTYKGLNVVCETKWSETTRNENL